MRRSIYNITPFTLLDYPEHTACIIWFAGCNMRCQYCYNPDIVLGKGKLTIDSAVAFLHSRQQLLEAVVFSGGECTLHPSIVTLAREAKKRNYLVKIDTNGTQPRRIDKLLQENLVDYIALDFKAPPYKHADITQSDTWTTFTQSLQIIQDSQIQFEIRTTWHSELLNTKDLQEMIHFLEKIKYKGNYYIQRFVNEVPTLSKLSRSNTHLDLSQLTSPDIRIIIR
ncbi:MULTISPECIES: anaerobic ribonucleoside-triphosphate reductase activating protein [Sphingobacterium]|uniref:anaerobic ribonucleoside-triphosphate reductase activating protein n=1 Tax=Sphingobacterium TaxID=28453 RepID=UPI0013DA0C94|nr:MULTISPECIES: anaerobic ribonucleoside-triphosphate reductase activating protein [unclassified Sphingobacterium]